MLSSEEMDNLMVRISRREMVALEEFYEEMSKAVYGLAYVITKSPYDAEDIMQNTFIRVWDKAHRYRCGTNAKAWVMKIARNLALTKREEGKRFVELDEELPSEDMYRKMLQFQELNSLLSILKKEEREIVVLYSVGFSHKEIAEILKRPYATVRWKYSNAISKLSQKEQSFGYDKASAEMESNYERT